MTAPLEAAVARLVARFRRQRPLRAGSLIVTVYGDAIAPRGGAVTLGSLIRLVQPFGVTERLVRTSVGRLAAEDWLENARSGRLSEYALSASGRARFAAATRRIYGAGSPDWNGRWTLVLFPELRGADRQTVRDALAWAGFGEPTSGVFMHPGCTPDEARERLEALGAARQAVVLCTTGDAPPCVSTAGSAHPPETAGDSNVARGDATLVRTGWQLDELGARYQRFVRSFEPIADAISHGAAPSPASAFALRTLLVHEYRRILLRDPMLPKALLPQDWAGSSAYDLCRQVYARVFLPAEEHLTAVGARLDGSLPPPSADTYERFGGLARG